MLGEENVALRLKRWKITEKARKEQFTGKSEQNKSHGNVFNTLIVTSGSKRRSCPSLIDPKPKIKMCVGKSFSRFHP